MAKVYKVYICHSWDHVNDLEKLRNLLNERDYFKAEFTEHSPNEPINSDNATYVKRRLKKSILESDIVIGLAGIYSSHSEWIEWELQTAKDNEISIIGVIPRGQERISQTVYSRSKVDVRWNTESIVDAIRTHSK